MTLDEFRAKYRLQKRLTQRGVASYEALDSSGRVVMVHSLDSAPRDEVDEVRSLVHQLDAGDRKKILEILDVDGAPVLVTEYLQAFRTLAQWLEIRTGSAARAPGEQPNRPPRGEFTQLFGPAEVPKTPVLERPATASSPSAVSASGKPAAPETPRAGEFTGLFGAVPDPQGGTLESPAPGDFTQLFGPGAGAPAAVPSEPPASPPPTPPPVQHEQPKVVVRWRDSPPAESPPQAGKPLIRWKQPEPAPPEDIGRSERRAPPPSPPPPKAPGEFTRLFGPQGGVTAPDSGAANVPPSLAEPPAPDLPLHRPPPHPPRAAGGGGAGTKAPGGFTQLLRAATDSPGDPLDPAEAGGPPPLGGPPAVSGSPAKAAPGEFTSLMAGLPSAPAAPGAAPRAPAQPAGFGPSEFTRIVAGMPMPSAAPAPGGARPKAASPPAGPAAEDEGERPSLVWLFVALGVVFLLAAALVVFFALKK